MSKSAVVHARIEPQIKSQAEKVLKELGLSATDAIRLFYRQIYLQSGLPFKVNIPNKATRDVLTKSQKNLDIEEFKNLDSMFRSWEK